MTPLTTGTELQSSAFEKAPERPLGPLKFFVGAFLASSIAICLTMPAGLTVTVKMLRWAFLACAAALSFAQIPRLSLSRQAVGWLASGLYAAGTVIYTIDIPATVLRSVGFSALTVGAFLGGAICYQEPVMKHRLPGRIGLVLIVLAAPSFGGYVLGYPDWFFHEAGLFRGLFVHANTLGAFGAIWLVVGVCAFDCRFSRHRKLLLIGLLAMAFCLVCSKSRAGTGGAAISILLYVLVTRHVRRLVFAAALAATLLLSAFILLPFATDYTTANVTDFAFKGN